MSDDDPKTPSELTSYWAGRVILAIGEGTFRGVFYSAIAHTFTVGARHGEKIARSQQRQRRESGKRRRK